MKNVELVNANTGQRDVEQPAAKTAASFPQTARLLKHSDFERVYKQGRRHFSSHMTVFYLRRVEGDDFATKVDTKKSSRVGFTVGRVLGGAVQRNRIKRRLREAVRLRGALLQSTGVDVVFNPKKSVLTLEFSAVLEEVGRALDTIAKKLVLK